MFQGCQFCFVLDSVIVVKRKQPLTPLTCKPKSQYVTKRNGHIETTLTFSQPVSTIDVSMGSNKAVCTVVDDEKWQIALDNVTTDDIVLTIIANGRLLPKVTLKVKTQGISKNNDPLGGKGL